MARWWLFLVAAGLCQVFTQAITELAAEEFYPFVRTEGLVAVNFYAPWCGHCQTFANVFSNVANKMKDYSPKVSFAKVDGSKLQTDSLLASEGVDGYPTILLYRDGRKITEYHGNRTEADFLQFIKARTKPRATQVESQLDLMPSISALGRIDEFYHGFLAVVLGVFPRDRQGFASPEAQLFMDVADSYEFATFFITDSVALMEDFSVDKPTVIVFPADDRDVYHAIGLPESPTKEGLINELVMQSMPLSLPYGSDTQSLLSALPVSVHALAFYDPSSDGDSRFLDVVQSVLPAFKGRLIMVEVSSEDYSICHQFGIESTGDLPQLILVDTSDEGQARRFSFTDYVRAVHMKALQEAPGMTLGELERMVQGKMEQPLWMNALGGTVSTMPSTFTSSPSSATAATAKERLHYNVSHVEQFFNVFLEDLAVQTLRSQSPEDVQSLNTNLAHIPETNIAGFNFHEMVVDDDSFDSFVFFYAPWCIHCKALEAVVAQVADTVASSGSAHGLQRPVRFFRMDVSKNDVNHPAVHFRGVPAMYLFPQGQKREVAIAFDDDRTEKKILKFLVEQQQLTNGLSTHDIRGDQQQQCSSGTCSGAPEL